MTTTMNTISENVSMNTNLVEEDKMIASVQQVVPDEELISAYYRPVTGFIGIKDTTDPRYFAIMTDRLCTNPDANMSFMMLVFSSYFGIRLIVKTKYSSKLMWTRESSRLLIVEFL